MAGQFVCGSHGGRSPQAMRSAKQRLAELVEPAVAALAKALRADDYPALIRAAQVVLDRTGFHPSQTVELSGPDGSPVEHHHNLVPVHRLSPELRRRLLEELEAL